MLLWVGIKLICIYKYTESLIHTRINSTHDMCIYYAKKLFSFRIKLDNMIGISKICMHTNRLVAVALLYWTKFLRFVFFREPPMYGSSLCSAMGVSHYQPKKSVPVWLWISGSSLAFPLAQLRLCCSSVSAAISGRRHASMLMGFFFIWCFNEW